MSRRRLTKFNRRVKWQSKGCKTATTRWETRCLVAAAVAVANKEPKEFDEEFGEAHDGSWRRNVDQDPWRILAEWVPHYKSHIAVRKSRNLLHPIWDDLMLWAVLTRETSMVKPLWARSREPMRLALSASHFCQRLAALPHLRSEHETLRQQAVTFEDWAISLLDAIDDSEAVPS